MSLLPLLAALGLVVGGVCFVKCAARWDSALHILTFVTLFGGIIAVDLGSGAYLILFRDIFVVLPLYFGFFRRPAGQIAASRIPVDLLAVLFLLLTAILLSLINSLDASLLQLLIGLKVWLYYIPFIAVGLALAADRDRLFLFFRQFLLWGLLAAGIGLVQSLLVRLVGYERAIGWFFGSHADAVTQGFSFFDVAGGIYRIPGTFSFISQYAAFLHVFIAIAMIEINADDDARIRKLAQLALFVGVAAAILSGAREAIIFVPATLLLYVLCGLLSLRLLLLAPVGLVAGLIVLRSANLDLISYFFLGSSLAGEYGGDFVWDQIARGLDYGVMGAGIGTSTTAARYAAGGIGGGFDQIGTVVGLESNFGKAAGELGWLGFVAIAMLMATIAARSLFATLRSWRRGTASVVAPLAIYLAYNVIVSFKGYVLDTDPSNIVIWLSLGIVIGLDRYRAAEPRPTFPEVEMQDAAPDW